ncbi:MAG: hypothetical protein ABIE70_09690 [bacterium]
MTTYRHVSTTHSGFMPALIATVAVFLIMLLVSCSGNSPTQPNTVTTPDINDRAEIFRLLDPDKGGADEEAMMSSSKNDKGDRTDEKSNNGNDSWAVSSDEQSVEVGSGVSTLRLTLDGQDVSVLIPRGAAPIGTVITISGTKYVTPQGECYIYDCAPEGIVFSTPLQITQPINRPEGCLSGLFWWDPARRVWILQEVSRINSRMVTFEIYHFSKYGIS